MNLHLNKLINIHGLIFISILFISCIILVRLYHINVDGFTDVIPVTDVIPGLEKQTKDGQMIYNPLSQMINPFAQATMNPADVKLALGGTDANYSSGNKETLQTDISKYFLNPRSDKEDGVIKTIQFCKEKGTDANPFMDARFAANCGVCLADGTDEEGTPFTKAKGQRGLFLYPEEKEQYIKEKQENALSFIKAKPSLASCSGAPDAPVFATNATDLSKYKKRMQCQTDKAGGLDKGCGLCMGENTYTFVDSSADRIPSTLVVRGRGVCILTIGGTKLDPVTLKNNVNTRISIPVKESSNENTILELSVSPVPPSANATEAQKTAALALYPYVYGYLEAVLPNSGLYQISIDKILTSDQETGSRPRFLPPAFSFPNGPSCNKMRSASGKTSLQLLGAFPFTFLEADEFATFDCRTSPLQTKQASIQAINMNPDPCISSSMSPGNYSRECLQARILDAGCTNGGTFFANPLALNRLNGVAQTIDQIYTRVSGVAMLDKILTTETAQCSGSTPPNPCEQNLRDPTKQISVECLNYLYLNKGIAEPRIGATYVGANSGFASKDSQGNNIFCLPSGNLSPVDSNGATRTSAVYTLRNEGTITRIKEFINDQFNKAINSSVNAQNAQRRTAIANCFNTIANIPGGSLA